MFVSLRDALVGLRLWGGLGRLLERTDDCLARERDLEVVLALTDRPGEQRVGEGAERLWRRLLPIQQLLGLLATPRLVRDTTERDADRSE